MKKSQALTVFFHTSNITEQNSGIPRDGHFFSNYLQKVLEDDDFKRKLEEHDLKIQFKFQIVRQSRIENMIPWRINLEREGIHFYQQIPALLYSSQINQSIVNIFRVHDLFPIEYPKLYRVWSRLSFKLRIKSIPQADILVANSDSTAQSLKNYLQKWHTLRVIECATPSFSLNGNFEINGTNLVPTEIGKFVLSVGAVVKRKSQLALIDFWERKISVHGYSLVMIGERTDHVIMKAIESRIRKHRNSNAKIYFYSNLDSDKFRNYYESASGYISISSFEGFNIPLHDAVMCGLPILCHSDSIKSQAVKSFAIEQGLCFNFNQVNEFLANMESKFVPNVDLLNELFHAQLTRYRDATKELLLEAINLWQSKIAKRQQY